MEVGQRVYVQKDELVFHKWYEAHIVPLVKYACKNDQQYKGTLFGACTIF